jgi:hypothetical protein
MSLLATSAAVVPQVTLQPMSILGPELAVRQAVAGEAAYFEVRGTEWHGAGAVATPLTRGGW